MEDAQANEESDVGQVDGETKPVVERGGRKLMRIGSKMQPLMSLPLLECWNLRGEGSIQEFGQGNILVMKTVALEAILASPDVLRQKQGWKLLSCSPDCSSNCTTNWKDDSMHLVEVSGVGIVTRRQRNPEDGEDVERVPTTLKTGC